MVFEGKNIEKAILNACKALNIEIQSLKYDIVSYGSRGIFGLVGKKNAKIRIKNIPQNNGDSENANQNRTRPQGKAAGLHSKIETPDSSDIYSYPQRPTELIRSVLEKIVGEITEEAVINIREDSDRVFVNIQGGKAAVLIGKRGQTLEAIQYIVEKIVHKKLEKRIRVRIDIEGYLKAKKKSLEKMAAKQAEKVRRTGKSVSMGQFNSHDRRIIHMALKSEKDLRTESMGNGYIRKLIIFPRKKN